MKKSDFLFILCSFLIWRIVLFIFLLIAFRYLPLQNNFLGGGMKNYLAAPWLWGWVNFDGEHYLAIAQMGYQPLTYFFFPIFPVICRFVGGLIGNGITGIAIGGLIVANLSFLISLIGIWKITEMDFSKKVARLTILLILFFPTSYYFGSYYTESIFLALAVWGYYFVRRDKWLWGGIAGGVSTAARIIGVCLFPAFAWEFLKEKKKTFLKGVSIFLVPIGIFVYMYYLYNKTGDPLNFLNTVSIFGAQRSSTFILLPQVFYRYFFKIIPSLNYSYFPSVFVTYLELLSALIFLVLSVISFWKLRGGYAIYLALGYLIPTLSGSFSSLPRYVLVLFPGFILMAIYLVKLPRFWKITVFSVLFISLGLATTLFLRGYWVS